MFFAIKLKTEGGVASGIYRNNITVIIMLMIMQFQFQIEYQKVNIPNRNVFLKICENDSGCRLYMEGVWYKK